MPHADAPSTRSGLLSLVDAVWPDWALSALDHPAIWEWQILLYERGDRRSTPPIGSILFTGSSSINLWSTLAEDMAPLPVLNRGFGGAHLDHVNRYAHRVVIPYEPKIIVLYAGENDLSGWSGKTPESVASEFDRFVKLVHAELPDTRILYLAIKPSLLREGLAEDQHRTNELIMQQAATDDRLDYADLNDSLLDDEGAPRRELFRWDRLHLNDEGYRLWSAALKPLLTEQWEALQETPERP
jgi:lysophospholipase L1-like esterase